MQRQIEQCMQRMSFNEKKLDEISDIRQELLEKASEESVLELANSLEQFATKETVNIIDQRLFSKAEKECVEILTSNQVNIKSQMEEVYK